MSLPVTVSGILTFTEIRRAFFDHLSADLGVDRGVVFGLWNRACSISGGSATPEEYRRTLAIMRNLLSSNAATASAFESTSFKAPEWWDKLSYEQQKQYLKDHKDTDLKINKKRTKTKKPKQSEKAPEKEDTPKEAAPLDDEETHEDDMGITRIPNIKPDDARMSQKQAAIDSEVDRHSAGHPEPIPQSGVGTDERALRIVKNNVAVGRQMVNDQVPTMMQRIRGIGKTAKLGIGAFAKLYSGKELTEEDLMAAKKVGSAIGSVVVGSLVGIAMFTPLAPFALHLGFQYAMKKNGFDNVFDMCKEEWESFMERLHNKDKVPKSEDEDEDADEKDRADRLEELEDSAKGRSKKKYKDVAKGKSKKKDSYRYTGSSSVEKPKKQESDEENLVAASVFESFAGDDQDMLKAIAHDMYDHICTTDIKQLTEKLAEMYGKKGERKPE